MTNPKAETLKSKLELDKVELTEPARGVELAWTTALVRGFLPGAKWELLGDTTLPVEPGEAMHKWIWGDGAARLTVAVFVSSDGPLVARRRLVTLATENMRPDVPFIRGPADLGDVSTIFAVPPAFAHLIWAYTNVCVAIKTQDAPGIDVTNIAAAMQEHLARHVVPRVKGATPQIEHAEPSLKQVPVGTPLTIRLRMRSEDAPRELQVAIKERNSTLRIAGDLGLVTTLSVDTPGPRKLTMMVADKSTLLSTWASVIFEVTPPAPVND
ncbi:hypothetical protein [Nannocystis bainbridge]|uniref:Uncharacterized protein n=1 Tax=Nannocystis bainbridge TaxID=2995303 RepID=A0ABT5DXJ2_9BACT|nr:hypothetical protein [Nannocystis bainbridge]MDC0717875.1 hypothetical protein [Nannocystis bainbridge]